MRHSTTVEHYLARLSSPTAVAAMEARRLPLAVANGEGLEQCHALLHTLSDADLCYSKPVTRMPPCRRMRHVLPRRDRPIAPSRRAALAPVV